jgi:hypothetical protein
MCLMRSQFEDEPDARKTMLRRVTVHPDIQMDLWFEGGRAVVQDVATGVLSYGATGICALTRALIARSRYSVRTRTDGWCGTYLLG